MEQFCQGWIVFCGVLASTLISRLDKWKKYGYLLAFSAQPATLYLSWIYDLWGPGLLAVWAGSMWAGGIYNYWVKEPRIKTNGENEPFSQSGQRI